MPFYVGDYLADTGHLSAAENGAYLLLIMHYWRTGNIPPDDEMRRRVSRMTHREWQRSRETVLSFFSPDGKHKRVDEELARVNHKSAVLRDNALKSHESRHANAQQKHLQNDCIARVSEPEPYSIRDTNVSLVNAEVVDLSEASKSRKTETLRVFGETWNALAAELGLPAIETIKPGSTRERHALARARELVADYPDLAAGLKVLTAKIRGSPLLRGEVGNRQWRASFDWVVNAANFTKIMEGVYEVRQTSG
jgi:uncharacterized protein YdaU (DUF1376 family)